MKKIAILALFFNIGLAQSSDNCSENLDSMGQKWTQKTGRTQIIDLVQYTAFAISSKRDQSRYFAQMKSLNGFYEECLGLPRSLKAHEECEEQINNKIRYFIRYSAKKLDCNSRSFLPKDSPLQKKFKEYLATIKRQKKTELTTCKKSNEECLNKATGLFNEGLNEESFYIARTLCIKRHRESCSFLGSIFPRYNSNKTVSLLIPSVCNGKSEKSCKGILSHAKNSTEWKNITKQSCDLGSGTGCYFYALISGDESYFKNSCLNMYKPACLELIKRNPEAMNDKSLNSSLCRYNLIKNCNANSEDIEVGEDSIQEFKL